MINNVPNNCYLVLSAVSFLGLSVLEIPMDFISISLRFPVRIEFKWRGLLLSLPGFQGIDKYFFLNSLHGIEAVNLAGCQSALSNREIIGPHS